MLRNNTRPHPSPQRGGKVTYIQGERTVTYAKGITRENVIAAPLRTLGRCIELVAVDPHFHDITVGLYLRDRTLTIYSFAQIEGKEDRIRTIRDRLCALADIEPAPGTHNQAELVSQEFYDRPLRFAFTEAVERDQPIPTGPISVNDTKSKLTFTVTPEHSDEDGWTYRVTAEGDFNRPQMRIMAVVGGYMRYGDCERVGKDRDRFRFKHGERLDRFARLLLPYARNVSAVDNMLEQSELAGQMTTQTLGFASN